MKKSEIQELKEEIRLLREEITRLRLHQPTYVPYPVYPPIRIPQTPWQPAYPTHPQPYRWEITCKNTNTTLDGHHQ